MKVKIANPTEWGEGKERKRYEAGSVIDVPAEVYELNSSWMKATNEDLTDAPVPAAKKPAE